MFKKKKEQEASNELAKAMTKLAEALERYQDPVIWQKIFRTAFQEVPSLPERLREAFPSPPQMLRVEQATITLSEETRGQLASLVFEKIQPQLTEFDAFVKESLKELPAARLKELAEKVEAGITPRLGRAKGCVYIEAEGGERHYLGL